jgi:hypothetical protein
MKEFYPNVKMESPTFLENTEIIWTILLQCDYDTILAYSGTCTIAREIYDADVFWVQKAELDYSIKPHEFRNTNLPSIKRYVQILTQNWGVVLGSQKYISFREFVRRSIRNNRQDLVNYGVSIGFNDWYTILSEYAMKGDVENVNLYLITNPDYQASADGALYGKQLELFKALYMSAPSDYPWNWQDLAAASLGSGYRENFNYVRGISPFNFQWDWYNLLWNAISSGNLNLFDYVRKMVPYGTELNWNNLLATAAESGSKELFNYIIELNPNYQWDWNLSASSALTYNNRKLFNHIRFLSSLEYIWNWNDLAYSTLIAGEKKLFDYIRNLADSDWVWNYDTLCWSALSMNFRELFDYLRTLAGEYIWDWNYIIGGAIASGYKDLFDYVRCLAPNYIIWNWEILETQAQNSNNQKLIDHITDLTSEF